MSGSIRRFNPRTRTFTSQGPDGKWQPEGPVVERTSQGIVANTPPEKTGPEVLTQKPAKPADVADPKATG